MQKKVAGHVFLAKLGKTKLRPGGITATNWLIEKAQIKANLQILEVACNMGTTMIHLAKTYHCKIVGLDQSPTALAKAKENIAKNQLEKQLSVIQGNALRLPFKDNTFDVLINEAMLTMLSLKAKEKAIAEYYRVLKPGGKLLTHDVCLFTVSSQQHQQIVTQLSQAINVHVNPLTATEWKQLFERSGFENQQKIGKMSLMNPIGMIKDEGVLGSLRIIKNGWQKENRPQFFSMFKFFNQHKRYLGYVANFNRKL